MSESSLEKLVAFLRNDMLITKIHIYQIDFLIMYYPFYMLISDLSEHFIVEFDNSANDDHEVILKLNERKIIGEDSTLYLGVCEPVMFNNRSNCVKFNLPGKKETTIEACHIEIGEDGKKRDAYYIHLPFLNFPPIYGVSLLNRPIINKIKRSKSNSMTQLKSGRSLSILDYWRHFSAKLSILDASDFKILNISTYPKGTTQYHIISRILDIQAKNIIFQNIDEEYKNLFAGQVDVAMTVNPWAAISQSVDKEYPFEIEFVYNSVTVNYNTTSIIIKTDEPEDMFLADVVQKYFGALLYDNIKALMYQMNSDQYDNSIKTHCILIQESSKEKGPFICADNCPNYGQNIKKIDTQKGCLFEKKLALRLNNDSRIYKNMAKYKEIYDNDIDIGNAVAEYFFKKYSNNIKKYLAMLSGQAEYNNANIDYRNQKLYKKYAKEVNDKLSELEDINISKELSRVIGYSDNIKECSNINCGKYLSGFFRHDTHGGNFNDKIRNDATTLLEQILKNDTFIENNDEIFNFIKEYNNKSTDRNKIRETSLTIHYGNITSLFPSNIKNCKKCNRCHEIQYSIYNNKSGDESYDSDYEKRRHRLYIPPSTFVINNRYRLQECFNEIIQHSLCTKTGDPNFSIQLQGRNLGKYQLTDQDPNAYIDCLYLLVIKITPNNKWEQENGQLEIPQGMFDDFKYKKNYQYYDHIVVVPKDGQYEAIYEGLNQDQSVFNSIQSSVKYNVRVNKKITLKWCTQDNKISIKSQNDNYDIETTCEGPNNPIFHIFVFNNHQDIKDQRVGQTEQI